MRYLHDFNFIKVPALVLFSSSLVLPFTQSTQAMPRSGFSTTTPPSVHRQFKQGQISMMNRELTIQLVNEMNTPVTYQVIGDTSDRLLFSSSSVSLKSLTTPTTITFYRPDGGFIQATPEIMDEKGILQITLQEAFDVDQDDQVLRINDQGGVYIN